MRVHELAKELDVPSKDLIEDLREMGFDVKSHMSALSDEEIDKAREDYGVPAPGADASAAPTTAAAATTDEPVAAESGESEAVEEGTDEPSEPDDAVAEEEPVSEVVEEELSTHLLLRGPVSVRDLADMMRLKPNQLVADLMGMNVFASINETIEVKQAQKLADKHGFTVELEKKKTDKKPPPKKIEKPKEPVVDNPDQLQWRPPIVTFLGHVDHGKTSILDYIRSAKVAAGESGGITQHIGAYMVEKNGKRITFLDTPGHAAFTNMRARGANLTDIAILVIAADDGIMPQTREAIQHAKAAGVTIMVAINKMDLPSADPDKVKQQLQTEDLAPEDWGGEIICCPVSAATGDGMDNLLEMIALQAEVMELQANPKRQAEGYVIESQLEPGRGPTANLLVRRGTLKVGDTIVCGPYSGKVKALIDDQGKKVKVAGPSTPVKCMGLTDVPGVGSTFQVYANPKEAKALSEEMLAEARQLDLQGPKRMQVTLDELLAQTDPDLATEMPVILKTDVQGSNEALVQALGEIKSDKVKSNFILRGVGNITVNDVMLASASKALILGFHVGKENGVNALAKREGVDVRLFEIIYELIDNVRDTMTGMLEPDRKESVTGQAEVLQIFDLGKRSRIAGCLVKSGRVGARAKARVLRGNSAVFEGQLSALRRFQNDAKEVREGQECGIGLNRFNDFQVGDIIEVYNVETVAAKL